MEGKRQMADTSVVEARSFPDRLYAAGVVPVVTMPEGADAAALGRALADAGLDVIEITLRTAGGLDAIRSIRKECPNVLVGAGTVLDASGAHSAIQAGAHFLVSPGCHLDVLDVGQSQSIPVLPGVLSPTDIGLAQARGISIVKLFPAAAAGGLPWLNALAAPYRDVRFVPTGGLGLSDVADYLRSPAVVAIGGSWIAPAGLIATDMSAIRGLAREAAAAVATARGNR